MENVDCNIVIFNVIVIEKDILLLPLNWDSFLKVKMFIH